MVHTKFIFKLIFKAVLASVKLMFLLFWAGKLYHLVGNHASNLIVC